MGFCCADCIITTFAYAVPGLIFGAIMSYTSTGILVLGALSGLAGECVGMPFISDHSEQVFAFGVGFLVMRLSQNGTTGMSIFAGIMAMYLLPSLVDRLFCGNGNSSGKTYLNPDTKEPMNFPWYRPNGEPRFAQRLGDRGRLLFGNGGSIYDRMTRYNPNTLDEKP
jgi:hypothetical protein